jgi:hypothetical protein
MNKIYFFVPLIGLLLFGGFYMQFNKGYKAEIKAKADKQLQERRAKEEQDLKNRELANKMAIEIAEKRSKERAEKTRIEDEKKAARLAADEKYQQVVDERKRLREQVDRLKKDVAAVKEELEKNETIKSNHAKEIVHLQEMVKKTEASQKYYYDLLDKIAAVEKAAADAAAAAAAAKKS